MARPYNDLVGVAQVLTKRVIDDLPFDISWQPVWTKPETGDKLWFRRPRPKNQSRLPGDSQGYHFKLLEDTLIKVDD